MTEQVDQGAGSFPKDADPSWHALYRLAIIAWTAIVLGLVIQALILAGKLASGGSFPGPPILADMAQGITWSLIVCLGVGIGTMVMRASLTLAGLIGFVAAPMGLAAAKGVQQGINQLIDSPQQAVSVALLVIAAIKAFEYGCLTYRLTGLAREQRGHLRPYLVLGLGTGAVFGGLVVLVSWQFARLAGSPPAPSGLVGLGVNEILFPAGCALVIFASQYIGGHVRVIEGEKVGGEVIAASMSRRCAALMTSSLVSQVLGLAILAGGIWLSWRRWVRPIAANTDFQQRALLLVLIVTMIGGFAGAPFWWIDYPASFSWDLPALAARMLAAAGFTFGIAGVVTLNRLDPRVVRLYLVMLAVYLTPLVAAILVFHLDRFDWRAPITYAFFIVACGMSIAALWHLVRGTPPPVVASAPLRPDPIVQLLLITVATVTGLWAVALFISPAGPSRFIWIWPGDALTSRLIATMLLTVCAMSALVEIIGLAAATKHVLPRDDAEHRLPARNPLRARAGEAGHSCPAKPTGGRDGQEPQRHKTPDPIRSRSTR